MTKVEDRRILNEDGLLVFPEREPYSYKNASKPYSCAYHTGGAMGSKLRELIKEHNNEINKSTSR